METLAPPVVAVVVTHDPGPWFEETLASIATQDYAELSVLVLDSGSGEDLVSRVAAVLPTAYVRHFDDNRGFGATVNEVRTMVDGADYFLVCHDDVALFPDTVHLMVEEAFRSNAGVVSPKVVSWDDPERLLHVGMAADKGGSVVERVQPNEIDHGQHDAVRDVFVAPGGTTLVRADLFEELEGYDPAIVAMGEDLDLCWRAQVAGARIIVAPDARIRHLEELAGGARPLERSLEGLEEEDTGARSAHFPTLQELQRRHELLAVLKCYGPFHLVRVVPQLLVLAVAEVVVAELAGNRARARAVVRAWRWNLARLPTIRSQRKELKGHRRLGDKEIRVLQIGGSARLSSYFRRVFQLGFHGAHADELAAADVAAAAAAATDSKSEPEPADAARGSELEPTRPARGRVSGRVRVTTWSIATVIVLIGTRGVLSGRLPVVGEFVPFPSWWDTLTQFVTGWHPSGVGTTSPASPALGLVGLVGTVFIGGMGLTQKVLIFACIPLGVWGVTRLLRPFGSQRAAMVAGLAYLAMALPYDGLALGRWEGLVVYAGGPWVLARLFRATGASPYAVVGEGIGPDGEGPSDSTAGPTTRWRMAAWTRRHPRVRGVLALGLIESVMVSFAPAAAIVVVVAALALVLSSALNRDGPAMRRSLWLAAGSTAVVVAVCLPWVVGVLSAGRGAIAVFGVPVAPSSAPTWSSILRFAVGPIGGSPLSWGFVVAAVAPLVLARGVRFQWAVRLWSVALVFWVLTWIIARGWTGSLAVDPLVLLGPAAVATAAAIGLGVAAFEEDLRAAEFGWRQLVTVVATAAVVVGAFPSMVSALPGRWELPLNDFSQSVAWMQARASSGAFRVLWVGDTRSLNQGSWSAGDGVAYATSENGSPDARWLWSAAGPGPAAGLASAVDLARSDHTDQLGRLLAPSGVRYVVLLTSLAPEIAGEQTPTQYPVPADLAPALSHQLDLSPVLSGTGITVYANSDWVPQRAEVAPGTAVPTSAPDPLAGAPGTGLVPGAAPVLPGPKAAVSYAGPLSAGTVLAAVAPAGRWTLSGPSGSPLVRSDSFGWGARYRVAAAGKGVLEFDGGILTPLAALLSIVVWLAGVALLVGQGSLRPPSWVRLGRRRRGSGPDGGGTDADTAADPAPRAEPVAP